MHNVSDSDQEGTPPQTHIMDLKPGMENISLKVRVIKAEPSKVIQTKKGARTISNAIIGDESGRTEAVLWGEKAGTLKEGSAIEIRGAWTTSFRGKVQVNIGRTTAVNEIGDEEVPQAEDIPEESPQAPEEPRREFRGPPRRFSRGRRERGEF